MAGLLLDRVADFVDVWALLLGNGKKLLPGLITIGTRLRTETLSHLRMHPVNQFFVDPRGLVKERSISRITKVSRNKTFVNQQ